METIFGMALPTITPLTPDFELDCEALIRHLKRLESFRVESVIALGMTGESLTLEMNVKERMIYETLANFEGNVIVCTGDKSPSNSIHLAKYTKELGATGILVPPPYGGDGSVASMAEHYRKVAYECEGMHRMIYHNPHAFPGIPLDFFREYGGVLDSAKDSSGDFGYFSQLLCLRDRLEEGERFGVFQGDEKALWLSREQGADGFVPSTANVNTEACMDAWVSTEGQARLSEMHDVIYPAGKNVQGLKYALSGIELCSPTHTLEADLTPEEKAAIDTDLANLLEIHTS